MNRHRHHHESCEVRAPSNPRRFTNAGLHEKTTSNKQLRQFRAHIHCSNPQKSNRQCRTTVALELIAPVAQVRPAFLQVLSCVSSAPNPSMIAPSSRLGPYEITSRIGAGGMGEVWRARDTRIGRDVAIKILPPEFASDTERLRRFELEARSAGGLSHPNLVTIHDLGTHEGTPYIVMELLEGETLRDRIGSESASRMPIRKAVDVSVQLANGLAAAHDKGIVHRDLKPENIFITPDGRVKILDFGLAKLTLAQGGDDSRTQQRDTTPGMVVGTAGYMSPEQVRGQEIDHRTDIFAFGAILYEMLTGHRAFRRDSSVETMSAILNEDPPELSSPASNIPSGIHRIVSRCLEKSRDERFQSARDLSFALEAVSGSTLPQSGVAAAAPPRGVKLKRLIQMLAALLVISAIAAAYFLGRRATPASPAARLTQLTFSAGEETNPAIAPNGETFVFVREGDIHLQRIDGRNALNLTKTAEIEEGAPSFSPDGRQIAFHAANGIFVMGATGESIRRLTTIGFDPTWSPDGKQIAFTRDEPTLDPRSRNTTVSPLMVVDASGGAPKLLLNSDVAQPRWSPDGRRIAFWANDNAGRRDIYTVAATGAKESVVRVTSDAALDWSPAWSPDNQWLYFSSDRNGTSTPWRIRIDSADGTTRGEPQMISAPGPATGWISVAADGRRIIFETISYTNSLRTARFDSAKSTFTLAEKPILDGSLLFRTPSPSPDGSMIAFTTEGREDLFVMRSDGTDLRQLTNDDARDRGATWTPDGQRIGFYSARSGSYQIWTVRPDGSELTQVSNVPEKYLPNFPLFSPDGRKVVAVALEAGWWMADLSKLPVTSIEFLPQMGGKKDGTFRGFSWSPDGSQIVGRSWTSRKGIWVYSLADRSFEMVAPDAYGAVWVDNHRLIVFDGSRVRLLDLRTGADRILLAGEGWNLDGGASVEHFVMQSSRVERDVWMATLPAE